MAGNAPPGAGGDAAGSDYDRAVDHLRATAKWLLGTFAAIGAVLVAGTQVSKIGQLAPDWRLALAVIAFAVGLLAVGVAILAVLNVLTSGHTSIAALHREQTAHPHSSLSQMLAETSLLDEYDHRVSELIQEANDALNERAAVANDDSPQGIARYKRANATIAYTNVVKGQLLALARNQMVRDEFDRQRWPLLLAGLVAACAIATFAWAANPVADLPPAVQIPSTGTVELSAAGQRILAATLGPTCVPQPVRVVVIGASDGKFDLVVVPTDQCRPARFTLPDGGGIGVLTPEMAAGHLAGPTSASPTPPALPEDSDAE